MKIEFTREVDQGEGYTKPYFAKHGNLYILIFRLKKLYPTEYLNRYYGAIRITWK